ncbi:MAG TPA: GDP-mannose 4,6-dehydratase [Solirubrobacteraceae bacterium]|nr:GDP-mannose 4,6-dehydratase [Solirubrobacteraceae bacterium]
MSSRPSLVTGIAGQDGSYLAELLLAEGREVVGVVRPGSRERGGVAAAAGVRLIEADLRDHAALRAAIDDVGPEEVFHLAAPAFVPDSWRDPAGTVAAITGGTAVVLAAAREGGARVLVASSAEIFRGVDDWPQREDTPPAPVTPYGVAKLAAHQLVGLVRGRGLFACSIVAYNHESPRRPERYVTRTLSRGAAAVHLGLTDTVAIGDVEARRDWLHARDVVRGMVLALRHDEPGDYVLASGVARSVREFADEAFGVVGLEAAPHLRVDPDLVRGDEETVLCGDASRAEAVLGWEPEISFAALVREMVEADVHRLSGQSGA